MSQLVDTCGWIEWLTNGVLTDKYEPYMFDIEAIIVPISVQFELYKWAYRVKGKQSALEAIALTEQGQVLALTTSIALLAAVLSALHKLSFADAIIYASAQNEAAELITSDDHFKDLAGVTYLKKS